MALEALLVFLCLALPVRWIVQRELDRLLRERVGPRELFLDPGLVYITD